MSHIQLLSTSQLPSSGFSWVLLAAGASTRLGQPKQTLTLSQKSLIARQADMLLNTGLPVTVIEGAVNLAPWLPPITRRHLHLILNPHWQQGMHTSIQQALHQLPEYNVGWVLVDQYAINTQQCLDFYHHWHQHTYPVLVSRYARSPNAWGVPVITDARLNPTINKAMQGFKQPSKHHSKANQMAGGGLKSWLNDHRASLKWEEWWWPDAQHDLDTQAQWLHLQAQHAKGHTRW